MEASRDHEPATDPLLSPLAFIYDAAGVTFALGADKPAFWRMDRRVRHRRPNGREAHISFPIRRQSRPPIHKLRVLRQVDMARGIEAHRTIVKIAVRPEVIIFSRSYNAGLNWRRAPLLDP